IGASGQAVQIRVTQGGRMIGGSVARSGALIPSVQIGAWTTTCNAQKVCSSASAPGNVCPVQLQDSIWIDLQGGFDFPPAASDPGISGVFAPGRVSGALAYLDASASCPTTFTATK
ncbi:MAG: hypothetical protein ABI323_10325, partial [Solirubrobacteraceae bacterium]